MANFHDKIVLNKYLLSLFGIDALGSKILSKDGVEIFKELKFSNAEGYTEEGNTKFLDTLKSHLYLTTDITETMLQQYDENIVRYTKEISENRDEMLVWKYFQYLSLLFTEIYLEKFFSNKMSLLNELNVFVKKFNEKNAEKYLLQPRVRGEVDFVATKFAEKDLNKLAFWNATGSGKTLLMHVNIKQYLHYAKKYGKTHENKILLITPNEPLSRQHLEDLKLSGIPANIFSKNQTGMYSGKEVEILEISKLTEESKDKTVAVDSFETENLVLIDEGHGGMSGDQWKTFRDQLSKTGFAFEYSATFGQAINAATSTKQKQLTDEYSKSILFDYSYKYFYEDGYGKDYRILNLKEDKKDFKNKYLTANLLSFYQQLLIYKNKTEIVKQFRIFKPLWVFVGSSVNAVRKEGGKDTSDVLDIVHFISDFLKERENFTEYISLILKDKAGLNDKDGYSIFMGSFAYLDEVSLTAEEIYAGINEEIFHNTNVGSQLFLDNLKGANGELGLRVGENNYFGVINVGDEKKLHDLAINNGIPGSTRDFSDSLFAEINKENPTEKINMLIGSKKFSAGWSSWRVSSMGLMNIGKSEGSQIIQLFGRGVRLQGFGFSLKRSAGLDEFQKADNLRDIRKYLRPMETLQIFGVKADYMQKFKELLEAEGLPTNAGDWITVKVPVKNKIDINAAKLQLIQVKETENFKQEITSLIYTEDIFRGKQIEIDWYPKIDVLERRKTQNNSNKNVGHLKQENFAFVNWNSIFLEIQNYKADKNFNNIHITKEILQVIIGKNSWYNIFIPEDQLEFTSFEKVVVWEELVVVLLKKYIEQFFIFYKNDFNSKHIETRLLLDSDDNFITEYDVRLNRNEDLETVQENLTKLTDELASTAFKTIKIAGKVEAFDQLMHLYKPLFYVGKANENKINVIPVALNESEKWFVDDLENYDVKIADKKNYDELFLLRNQSRKGIGFFADGNNFYPDFILWIKQGDKQYLTFVDPKGIRNSNGMQDKKIQFYSYLKDQVQSQVTAEKLFLNSFIVSNTKRLEINWAGNIDEKEFNTNNVYFQQEQKHNYIAEIIREILK